MTEQINASTTKSYEKAVVQETKELLHYVVQRLMLTFNDEFKVAFNPSVLSQKNIGKEQLQRCLDELLESMAFQLAQELRATTLRIEKSVNEQRLQFYKMAAEFTAERCRYEFMELEETRLDTPEVEPQWSEQTRAQMVPLLKRFKNPKQFFEGNGRDILREELAETFKPEMQSLVDEYTEKFTGFYQEKLVEELDNLKEQLQTELEQYYNGLLESFGSKEQLERMQKMEAELTSIINQEAQVKHD